MDGARFDAITRTLHTVAGRRTTFGLLLGSALGLLGIANTAAGKKGKKKKKKKKGQGSSPPPAAPPPPPGGPAGCISDAGCNRCAQETCQAGTCACPEGLIRDAKGVCGVRPNCRSQGQIAQAAQECCSGRLRAIGGGLSVCDAGQEQCLSTADCTGGSACLGFMCPARYLATLGEECRSVVGCTGPDDCDTGLCRDGVCALCQDTNNCPRDVGGQCGCERDTGTCISFNYVFIDNQPCSACPPNTVRCDEVVGGVRCARPCGWIFE